MALENGAVVSGPVPADKIQKTEAKATVKKLSTNAGSAKVPKIAAPPKPTVTKEPTVKKPKALKPLPPLNWTSLAANLDLEQAEMRFQIREFTLRFACTMEPAISKTHLEELDNIHSSSKVSEDIAGWVSETCVRAILLGLLYLVLDKDNRSMEEVRTIIEILLIVLTSFL